MKLSSPELVNFVVAESVRIGDRITSGTHLQLNPIFNATTSKHVALGMKIILDKRFKPARINTIGKIR